MRKRLIWGALLLGGIVSLQAQTNLIPNGDFEQGKSSWLGRKFQENETEGRNNSKCLESEYVSEFDRVSGWLLLNGLSIENINGKTYEFSFWISGDIDISKVRATLYGTGLKNSESNGISFTESETSGDWKKYSKEITLTQGTKITGIRLNTFDQPSFKIDDVFLGEKVTALPAPDNLAVVQQHQREAVISWDAVSGASSYKVKVGEDGMEKDATGTQFVLTDLEPGQTYTVKVKADDSTNEAELSVTTTAITTADADLIPYVFINEDNSVSKTFRPFIYDAKEKPTVTQLSLDGTVVTPTDGVYILTEGSGKKLQLTLTLNGKTWVLEYMGVTVK